MAKKNGKGVKDRAPIRGMARIHIVNQDGTLAGDSGWVENSITDYGYTNFLVRLLAAQANSKQIGGITLGSGTAPNATHSTLHGEISTAKRKAPTFTLGGTKTCQFTATFQSSDSFLAGASNLSNIGLVDVTTATGSLMAGTTYTSSSCDTNQNVNVTYSIIFG